MKFIKRLDKAKTEINNRRFDTPLLFSSKLMRCRREVTRKKGRKSAFCNRAKEEGRGHGETEGHGGTGGRYERERSERGVEREHKLLTVQTSPKFIFLRRAGRPWFQVMFHKPVIEWWLYGEPAREGRELLDKLRHKKSLVRRSKII